MWFAPLGDLAVVVNLGDDIEADSLVAVGDLAEALRAARLRGVTDIVPAFTTVTIFYEPLVWAADGAVPYNGISQAVAAVMETWAARRERGLPTATRNGRRREIPVCYGREFSPDLTDVAAHTRLSPEEIVARHQGAEYRVQAIGFAPGFPYLVGLPPELETPRRMTPRTDVPAGSVGIGGAQTGVYPMTSPGGWQLIGRTPLKLFDPSRPEPAWLRVGDVVTFRAIDAEEFRKWK